MPISSEELQHLRELAEAATPGPWDVREDNLVACRIESSKPRLIWMDSGWNPDTLVCQCYDSEYWYYDNQEEAKANSAFIATANPQTIIRLLDELERQEILASGYKTANEEAQELLDELRAENEQLNKEADWLANKLHKTLVIDGKSKVRCAFGPEQWREAARKAVESPENEAPAAASSPKWAWADGGK